ncbi:stemmadenine O-acetyltransferase-like [Silene latifolia]|uniref:stemmadenine O-acetyltransferase-like n=1 Tax=Silene latifolia TaxID=37657 RepID=UPI003D7705B6
MEKTLNVQVKVMSSEMVKPSIPTPNHLKTFNISYVDQILPLVPPFLSTGLVFYTAPPESQPPLDIFRLKASLSKTLSRFYPLAGRVKQSIIECNDEGIPFIETNVDCSLSSFLSLPNTLDFMTKFLPPRESLGIVGEFVTELAHLAIQVNVFTCGGVAIGWYDIHKIMDGTSSATFFRYWAGLASQRYDDLVQPDFDATVTAFPPLSKAPQLQWDNGYKNHVQDSPTMVKSFIFRNTAINDLKIRASSELVPNPSRYLALAGFIWENVMASKESEFRSNGYTDTILQVTLDLRPRINPPLPRGSIGNLVNTAVARAENPTQMQDLVVEINEAVAKVKGEIEGYQGEKAVENVRKNWNELIDIMSDYKERAYKLVSWSKLGFSDLDFGFGKPKWMVPTDGIMSPFHRNLIILTDYKDNQGDGIEAWFFLEEKDMDVLKSNEDFLAYATPAY